MKSEFVLCLLIAFLLCSCSSQPDDVDLSCTPGEMCLSDCGVATCYTFYCGSSYWTENCECPPLPCESHPLLCPGVGTEGEYCGSYSWCNRECEDGLECLLADAQGQWEFLSTCRQPQYGDKPSPSGPATIDLGCAPDDGPAFTVTVQNSTCGASSTHSSKVQITVWDSNHFPPPVGQIHSAGTATYYDGNTTVTAESFTLEISSWDHETNDYRGIYRLVLPDGYVIAGSYEAAWCDGEVLCG